jgi:hypothetical protein
MTGTAAGALKATAAAAEATRRRTAQRIEANQRDGSKACWGMLCQGERRPLSCFGRWRPTADGLAPQCRQCCAAYAAEHRTRQEAGKQVCGCCGNAYAGNDIAVQFTGQRGQPTANCARCRWQSSKEGAQLRAAKPRKPRSVCQPDACVPGGCCRVSDDASKPAAVPQAMRRLPSEERTAVLTELERQTAIAAVAVPRAMRRLPDEERTAVLTELERQATVAANVAGIRAKVERQREREQAHLAWCLGQGPHPDAAIRQRIAAMDKKRRADPRQRAELRAEQELSLEEQRIIGRGEVAIGERRPQARSAEASPSLTQPHPQPESRAQARSGDWDLDSLRASLGSMSWSKRSSSIG